VITNSTVARVPNIHHGWMMKQYTSVQQMHYKQMSVVPKAKQAVSRDGDGDDGLR